MTNSEYYTNPNFSSGVFRMMKWAAMLLSVFTATACGEARQADRSILVCANEEQLVEIALRIIPQMAGDRNLNFSENGESAKSDLLRIGDKGAVAPTARPINFFVSKGSGAVLLSGSNFGAQESSLSLGFFYVDSDRKSREFYNEVIGRLQAADVQIFDRTELVSNPC